MYKKLFKTSLMAAALSLIYACSPDEQVAPKIDSISKSEEAVACDIITFEHAATLNGSGFVTNVASAGGQTIGVQGFRRISGGSNYTTGNYANLFNTNGTNPGGSDDTDLMMAETGKVLIVNQTDNATVPDDFAHGSKLVLDFTSMGSVTLSSLTYLDNEEPGTVINLYNATNTLIKSVPVLNAGNGSVQPVDLGNTAGVVRMEVVMGSGNTGSGAIDNIRFCPQVQPPCDIITFEQLATRNGSGFVTSVKSLYGANIGVQGFRRNANGTYTTGNYANLFNTTGTNPGGSDDTDLMMAETGKVLIVNEIKNPDNASVPDDYARGAKLVVDFSSLGTVKLSSLTYLDNEEAGTKIYLYGIGDVLLNTIPVPAPGNGSVQTVDLGNTTGVVRMEVVMGTGTTGSGAIDNIVFCPEPPKNGCTRTQGYWKNHSKYDPKRYDATWAKVGEDTKFFKSKYTYYSILGIPPRGNAYYILAHQYVATTLNLKVASAPASVITAYTQATNFFKTYSPEQVAANKGLHTQATQLAGILDAYNNGVIGPGHCKD